MPLTENVAGELAATAQYPSTAARTVAITATPTSAPAAARPALHRGRRGAGR